VEENKATIKVYTFLFLFIIIGFIGFLVYQGIRDAEYKDKASPSERHRKFRSESTLITNELIKYKG